MKADLICDLQYGSTGKGLIAGYLAITDAVGYDMIINANMPNAGHTFIDGVGQKMVHKVLPNGLVDGRVRDVMIGPGSVFSPGQLQAEISQLSDFGYSGWKLWIHEDATVLMEEHKNQEEDLPHLTGIGSTKQGSVTAMIDKLMRNKQDNPTAGNMLRRGSLRHHLLTQAQWLNKVQQANRILIEGAQGYSLGLNAGFYPYCTSRDCTPSRIMADCGVPHTLLNNVIGTCRMNPIRVGGDSGPCYPDQNEISWEIVGVEPERTTVTNRERRLFTFSQQQMKEAIQACRPNYIFLNFCNYETENVGFITACIRAAATVAGHSVDVKWTGWGPTVKDVRERDYG